MKPRKAARAEESTITITVSEAKYLLWILDSISSLTVVADGLHEDPQAFLSLSTFIETINELNLHGSDSAAPEGLDYMLRDQLKRKTGMDFGYGAGFLCGSPPSKKSQGDLE